MGNKELILSFEVAAFWFGYVALTWALRKLVAERSFFSGFSVLNLVFYAFLVFRFFPSDILMVPLGAIGVVACYQTLSLAGRYYWAKPLAILAPILLLVAIRSVDTILLFGISFIAFRLSFLALDVQRGLSKPGLLPYLGYAFFPPTAAAGPISRYADYVQSVSRAIVKLDWWPWLMRALWGATKLVFLAPIIDKLTFSAFLMDGRQHGIFDFTLSSAAFYITIYLQFTGITDLMLSVAAFAGVKVRENFNDPLCSRNSQDHWRRWHITLMDYMREVVFNPLSLFLLRRFGGRFEIPVIVVSIFTVFLLIGLWHGLEWRYFAFGMYHAAGVAWIYVYEKGMRRLLGDRYSRFVNNRAVHVTSWFLTFLFISYGYFIYGNSKNDFWYLLDHVLVLRF